MMQPGTVELSSIPRMPNSISTGPPGVHNRIPDQNCPPPNICVTVETPSAPENPQYTTTGDEEHEGLISHFSKGKLQKFDAEQNWLLAVSALIITLSFAAVLQPPGGIRTDATVVVAAPPTDQKVGEANLLGTTKSFWVFFIANGSAMAAASSAVLLLISCPPRKDVQAFVLIMMGKFLVWIAIQCSLTSFCAAVWIIVGREKYKVFPFFIAAGVLYISFIVFFICGRMIRATARKAKIKIRHTQRLSGRGGLFTRLRGKARGKALVSNFVVEEV